MKQTHVALATVLAVLASLSVPASAQEHERREALRGQVPEHAQAHGEGQAIRQAPRQIPHQTPHQTPGQDIGARRAQSSALRFDQRYHHDHYYPQRGYAVPVLPSGSLSIAYGGGNWFFQGGVWFRPFGGRFVVSVPPIGIIVPILPSAYATLWIGGAPYYYANDVYYAPSPGQGYVVVAPPPDAAAAQPVVAAPAPKAMPDPILYPRNGQSAAQTEADRQDCNRWATTQPSALLDGSIFQRAVAACMDGRGYTVR